MNPKPVAEKEKRKKKEVPQIAYFGWNFAEGSSQEDLFRIDPATARIKRLTNDSRSREFISDRDPAWSPDHQTLAIHRASTTDQESRLYLLDGRSGRTLKRLVPGAMPEWYDETTLLFIRGFSIEDPETDVTVQAWEDVFAVDVNTLTVKQITDLSDANGSVHDMCWNPTRGLAFGYTKMLDDGSSPAPSVMIIPAAKITAALTGSTPVTKADLVPTIANAAEPDWSADGDRLAYVYFTEVPYPEPVPEGCDEPCTLLVTDIAVKDMNTGVTTVITDDGLTLGTYGPNVGGHGPALSPDGAQVAFTRGYEDEWQEIWISPSTAKGARQLTDENHQWFKGGLDW